MVDHNEIINLIARYLEGQASPEEAVQVQEWIDSSVENQEVFHELERVHSMTHGSTRFSKDSQELVWDKIVKQKEKQRTSLFLRNKATVIGIAAVLVLALITATVWFSTRDEKKPDFAKKEQKKDVDKDQEILMAVEGVESFTLADHSVVKLSEGSQLKLERDFNKNQRALSLIGSGEFHVVHDEKKPFIVSVKSMKIVDLGTIFRVKSGPDTVKIYVDEGAVQLQLNNQVLKLSVGDSAFYVIQKDLVSMYPRKKDRKNKVFEFDGTSLKEVVSVLSEFFERPIVIKDEAIAECPLTVRFKNENLPTILDIIRELMDIRIVNNNQVIELYGEGCN